MSAITMAGALTLISTNGDGPKLLAEAAAFVNALAALEVPMAVEIHLRPIGAGGAKLPDPSPATPNPEPAPAESPTRWRQMNQHQRAEAATTALRELRRQNGGANLTQKEYRERQPEWMPGPETLMALFKQSWADIWIMLDVKS